VKGPVLSSIPAVTVALLMSCAVAAQTRDGMRRPDAARPASTSPAPSTPAAASVPPPGAARAGAPLPLPANAQRVSHGRFGDVLVYSPAAAPKSFVLFLSGDDGWNSAVDFMAQQLVQQGAMVTGIDLPKFKAKLEADGDQCEFADGDLENLSHFVQAYTHQPSYSPPILVGYSSGATLAYAMLAQAPPNTFASALTLGFCPHFNWQKPMCRGSGLEYTPGAHGHGVDLSPAKTLGNPWVALQGEADRVCPIAGTRDFVSKVRGGALVPLPRVGHDFASPRDWLPQYGAAFRSLANLSLNDRIAPPAGLSNLPVIEIPAYPGAASSDSFAIIMSGDGGWAGLDQNLAAALSAKGIPVVGLDSLRYYWTPRNPDGVAADTDRMIRYYLAHWGKKRVLLIGYSQGADVLPFAINRLPAATRAHVALAAIMGMSEHAMFEFHLSNWIADDSSGLATLPEVDRIAGMPVMCVYGQDEQDSLCPRLDPKKVIVVKLKGGHHFDGNYAGLAQDILSSARP